MRKALAVAVLGLAVAGCGTSAAVTHPKPAPTVTVTRTVTRTIVRTKTRNPAWLPSCLMAVEGMFASSQSNYDAGQVVTADCHGLPTAAQWNAANATPAASPALPAGVIPAPGYPAGYYDVNCNLTQCTSLPGAGPNGTTCGQISTGEQLCSP